MGLNKVKFRYWKTLDITTENQISANGDILSYYHIRAHLETYRYPILKLVLDQ
jgi:hypothetical protein